MEDVRNAREVYVTEDGQVRDDVAPALALWSSRRSLTEILEAARGPRRTKARSRLRTRPPWLRAMLTFGRIQRAIFARRVTEHSPPVRIIADEFQEMLSPDVADDFERVLTLARSQKAFLTVLFQQAASVEKVSSTLLRVIKTNSNYHVAFRANDEDVRAMSHVLPVTGRVPRETSGFPDPRTPPTFLTPEEERRAHARGPCCRARARGRHGKRAAADGGAED
jgi:hypothetical protein